MQMHTTYWSIQLSLSGNIKEKKRQKNRVRLLTSHLLEWPKPRVLILSADEDVKREFSSLLVGV